MFERGPSSSQQLAEESTEGSFVLKSECVPTPEVLMSAAHHGGRRMSLGMIEDDPEDD
jgi:hypothetical protein